MRVVKGTGVVVVTEPFDATPSSVTATCVRASDGTTTTAPATAVSGDRVKVTLTAAVHTVQLDRLTITVVATVGGQSTRQTLIVDVVGAHYCTIGSLREEPRLDDTTRFPDALVAEVRDEITDYVERAAAVAFVPMWGTEDHIGDGTNLLVLRTNQVREIKSVTIRDVSQSVSDFQLLNGDRLHRLSGVAFTTLYPVTITYEHGHDGPPTRLVREVKKAIRSELLARGAQAPVNALWEQTPDGLTVRYSTPDWNAGRFTGTLTLDAAINAYAAAAIGFA